MQQIVQVPIESQLPMSIARVLTVTLGLKNFGRSRLAVGSTNGMYN
jgi:hypothetical protein